MYTTQQFFVYGQRLHAQDAYTKTQMKYEIPFISCETFLFSLSARRVPKVENITPRSDKID